jgi:hypothetical protein
VASSATALVRPRFFAGQLLTEDDLQQVIDYVVEKQRLHNRYLFGDGVACGLEVSCDPCDPGKVVVAPGYALDCCGNDIVLACPATVDVLAMIRDLRTRLRGGHDCGDPCEEVEPWQPPRKYTDVEKPEALADAKKAKDLKTVKNGKTAKRTEGMRDRVYCLYIRYADEQTEPVAPYAVDDACTGTTCEPTRVREGYRFELRCPGPGEAPDDILSHALACIGDFIDAESSFAAARALSEHTRRLMVAHQIHDEYAAHYEPISQGDVYEQELVRRTNELKSYVDDAGRRADDPHGAFDAFREAATWTARWHAQNDDEKAALRTHSQSLEPSIAAAASQLATARPLLGELLPKLETEVDRTIAQQVLVLAQTWAPTPATAPPWQTMQASYEALLFVAGAPHSRTLHGALLEALRRLRRDLLDRAGAAPRTHCDLVRQIDGILVPADIAGNELRRADTDALLAATERLGAALLRYFQDCFCAALNPSCTPCEDPVVLLACIRVDGCEVVDICNMGRKWILSAANLRYWLGPLRVITRLLEWACCEPIKPPRPLPPLEHQPEPVPRDYEYEYEVVAPAAAPAGPRAPMAGRLSLVELVSSPDFSADDLPDLLLGELAALYLPGGRQSPRLRFADFARVAEELGRMVAARYGADSGRRGASRVRGAKHGEVLTALETPMIKERVEGIAVEALTRAVVAKKLDLGEAVERSAEVTLHRLRVERDEAVRAGLERWIASEEGLTRSVRPVVEGVIERELPAIEKRQREELDRVVRTSGLDTASMTQRIGASVDAKVAALGLNRESLDSRISSTVQGTLAANGLVAEALARRVDDAVRHRLDAEGLEREALDRRLTLAVRGTLASDGLTATAIGERIQAEVAQVFAREGLSTRTLEERVDSRLRAGVHPSVEALTRELEALREAHEALVKRVGEGGGGGGAPTPPRRGRKKDEE